MEEMKKVNPYTVAIGDILRVDNHSFPFVVNGITTDAVRVSAQKGKGYLVPEERFFSESWYLFESTELHFWNEFHRKTPRATTSNNKTIGQTEILDYLRSHEQTSDWIKRCETGYTMDVPMMVVMAMLDWINEKQQSPVSPLADMPTPELYAQWRYVLETKKVSALGDHQYNGMTNSQHIKLQLILQKELMKRQHALAEKLGVIE